MDNKEVIDKLIEKYDEMNAYLENMQKLMKTDESNKDDIIELYKKINEVRNKARDLIGEYTPTDDVGETKDMKTLRKGFLAIINTVKASMLVENSYEGQRGINRLPLEILIPVIAFKLHHLPNSTDEIYTSQYFIGIEGICEEQTGLINKQIVKSEEAKNTLEEDLKNVDLLLNDYGTASNIYKGLDSDGSLNDCEKVFIQIEPEKKRILSKVQLRNTSPRLFNANLEDVSDLNNEKFEFKTSSDFDIKITDDSIISIGELQEINDDINSNLEKLQDTIDMLKKKLILLEDDKKNLEKVRDEFMKNTAQENANQQQE